MFSLKYITTLSFLLKNFFTFFVNSVKRVFACRGGQKSIGAGVVFNDYLL